MLDQDIRAQLTEYFKLLESPLKIQYDASNDSEMSEFVTELTSISDKLSAEEVQLDRSPSFRILNNSGDTGITFAGIPLGHEFTSLVLALLQASGRAPKVDQQTIKRIKSIEKKINFTTFVSLSCHNCPEAVQALNLMAVINPNITHTMVDGGKFQDEVESKNIMGVPAIFKDDEFYIGGRTSLEDILDKIGTAVDTTQFENKGEYDTLIIGGGPAAASAAIYAARKGIKVGMVAERFGGQVLDTVGIENFIGTKYIEGQNLAAILEEHVREHDIDLMNKQKVTKVEKGHVTLANGVTLKAKTIIIATGAKWRDLGVSGEKELRNKGIAYCPHCDGPLFKGKDIAVIGGGNSGVEAAIDLAGIVKSVSVFEFMPELKADKVLVDKLYSLPNVTVYKNTATKEFTGTDKLESIVYTDRNTGEEHSLSICGSFIQIGLVPVTDFCGEEFEKTRIGELVVDKRGATSVEGIFAAGDCTDSAYKQIIISMGSGATAALGAFDYLMRNGGSNN